MTPATWPPSTVVVPAAVGASAVAGKAGDGDRQRRGGAAVDVDADDRGGRRGEAASRARRRDRVRMGWSLLRSARRPVSPLALISGRARTSQQRTRDGGGGTRWPQLPADFPSGRRSRALLPRRRGRLEIRRVEVDLDLRPLVVLVGGQLERRAAQDGAARGFGEGAGIGGVGRASRRSG